MVLTSTRTVLFILLYCLYPVLSLLVVSYEIFVVTGDKLGGGTSSDVKICLFGSYGDSGERPLIRSKTNKNPFERKQVLLFNFRKNFFILLLFMCCCCCTSLL